MTSQKIKDVKGTLHTFYLPLKKIVTTKMC
jgi:hypothetical protein